MSDAHSYMILHVIILVLVLKNDAHVARLVERVSKIATPLISFYFNGKDKQ